MKNKLMNIILIAGVVAVILLGIASHSHAWKVTVKNGNENKMINGVETYSTVTATVTFYYNALIANGEGAWQNIHLGESFTYDSGGLCPSGFTGRLFFITKDGKMDEKELAPTSILGHEVGKEGFTAGCWDSSWTICRKRGQGVTINNNDYGFCK